MWTGKSCENDSVDNQSINNFIYVSNLLAVHKFFDAFSMKTERFENVEFRKCISVDRVTTSFPGSLIFPLMRDPGNEVDRVIVNLYSNSHSAVHVKLSAFLRIHVKTESSFLVLIQYESLFFPKIK